MQIKFLGTGGAFDYEYGNSAAWIKMHGKNILVDCGYSVYPRLREAGLMDQLDYILITHCHDDHVGSLCSVLLHQQFFYDQPRTVRVLLPNDEFGAYLDRYIRFAIPRAEKYVNYAPLEEVPGIKAIDTFGLHVRDMPSFGYLFEDESDIVLFSGDLGEAGIIFDHARPYLQDNRQMRIFHEMTFEESDDVHTYYKDLEPFLAQFDILGYHMDPRQNPDDNTIPLVVNQPELRY